MGDVRMQMTQISNCALYGVVEGSDEDLQAFIRMFRPGDDFKLALTIILFDNHMQAYEARMVLERKQPTPSSTEIHGDK